VKNGAVSEAEAIERLERSPYWGMFGIRAKTGHKHATYSKTMVCKHQILGMTTRISMDEECMSEKGSAEAKYNAIDFECLRGTNNLSEKAYLSGQASL
ncbi:MAG TPA: hypothetical protein VFS81_25585, partial [Candidatus Binatia bacterium]|nr:hypothetical protein [Candidatus Binatia bacterium]